MHSPVDRVWRDNAMWQIAVCKALIHQRRIVGETLGFPLVENANFDMLMDLYLARTERRTVHLWSLCAAANAPYSTAHRKVRELVELGLVLRHDDTHDRRRVEVELTDKGAELLRSVVTHMAVICWPAKPD